MGSEILSAYVWLSPTAGKLLRSVSQALKGAAPCKGDALTGALKGGEAEGLLADESLRKDFLAEFQAAGLADVSDATAARLVDIFGAVLQKRAKTVSDAAGKIAKGLPGGKHPTYADVKALLPKGDSPCPALKADWILWHQMGNTYDSKSLPALPEKVLKERLSLAACVGTGYIAEAIIALHVMENIDAYVAWEKSLAASHPPPASAGVLAPFSEQTCSDVATRRVLNSMLPQEASTKVVAEVASSGSLKKALSKLAEQAKAAAVLPVYLAPKAAKEPPEPRQKKKGGDAEPNGADSKAGASGDVPFDAVHKATASQELHWSLINYMLNPGTTLAKAAVKPASGAAPAATAAASQGGYVAGNKFTRVWAPEGSVAPGHTAATWLPKTVSPTTADFKTTWATDAPPGHTAASWSKGTAISSASTGSSTAAASSKASSAPAPKAAVPPPKATAAPAAKPAAAKASSSSAGAPEEGSVEAALCKLDLRCGRIMECSRVPDADSLYLLKINVGDPAPRQVVSSLVKHYKAEELTNREVVVYCNIKPGKMRGFESQAMVLAATKDKGSEEEVCELLSPPEGVSEGTALTCGSLQVGSLSATASVKHISNVWKQVQPLLQTNGTCEATFNETTLTAQGKPVKCKSLTSVGIY